MGLIPTDPHFQALLRKYANDAAMSGAGSDKSAVHD
jgi:hypothetical protein